MDDDAIAQLGGFALGEVLKDLELDGDTIQGGLGQLGLRSSSNAISKDSIYSGKYVDDGPGNDEREDWEAEVDKEMYDEKWKEVAKGPKAGQKVRGEEDDFDEFDEEEEGGDAVMQDVQQTVKEESPAAEGGLWGSEEPEQADPIFVPEPIKTTDIQDLFPGFAKGKKLDFTELFRTRPKKRPRLEYRQITVELPTAGELSRARSTKEVLLAPLKPNKPSLLQAAIDPSLAVSYADDAEVHVDENVDLRENFGSKVEKDKWRVPAVDSTFEPVELDDWESRIVWDASGLEDREEPTSIAEQLAPRNIEFEKADWTRGIIWDAGSPYDRSFLRLNLNQNDPNMLLEVLHGHGSSSNFLPTSVRQEGLDPLNLSNDKEYRVNKDKKRIRQTFGLLEVQHAWPAQKLQLPYYKTRLSKADTRAFHRPPIQFPANIPLTFTKVRSAKKRKDKQGRKIRRTDADSLRHMGEVTCRDTGAFVLFEYSEENPPIISNQGMGSIIVNYYRKRDTTDAFVPSLDMGEPFLLDPGDESPFKAFGQVEPGQTVTTLYNNLVRAPLFRQKPHETDFLLVKATIDGEAKYYLREIKTTFVIGQTYPLTEVPGPHSRKISTLIKFRLMWITFKLLEKEKRLKVNRLTRYFPEQNDLQMRQRLKEFMEYQRQGADQGYWQIKSNYVKPDESEILKNASPELVCLTESMQVGLRHLHDAGYAQSKVEEGGAGDDDSKLDIEQQLAPWITTKNFINATANKAMLKLHGEGDPTGRGEAFSFLRVSMKDIFLRAGEDMATRLAEMEKRPKSAHKYNVQEQQEIYKEEIARIWKAQADALSDPIEPALTQEDEDRFRGRKTKGMKDMVDTPFSGAGTPYGQRAGSPGSRASSPDRDDGASVTSGRGDGPQKMLRIRRLVEGKWESEIVRDPAIIAAYIRQRQTIEDEKEDANELFPSDDATKNERMKKRLKEQLEKLKRNQERRLARKNQKLGIAPGAIGVGGKKAAKPETTRVCGNCGQRGHMKTSKRLCPRWHEFNTPKDSSTAGALPSAFGGGLALPTIAPTAPSPPKPVLKFKLSTSGAMSPPPPPTSEPSASQQ